MDSKTELLLLLADERLLRVAYLLRELRQQQLQYPEHGAFVERQIVAINDYQERVRSLRGKVEAEACPAGERGPRVRY